MGLGKRQGDIRKKTVSDISKIQKGGELPCKRCGFYYPKYGKDVSKILGQFILCRYCYDSKTD